MTATHARVTNSNDFEIDDRYDGVPVIFKPGEAKVIPLEAAALFFGMPVDEDGNVTPAPDWGYFARRQGWTNMEPMKDERTNDMFARVTKESAEKCSKMRVEMVEYTLREVVAGGEELAPPRELPKPDPESDDPAVETHGRARRVKAE